MNTHLFKNYIRHFIWAKNEHSLHSPFVFEFYCECLKNNSVFYTFNAIEEERKKLINSNISIQVEDFGAGSKVNGNNLRKIKDIAKNSLKSKNLGQQLFRIVNYLQSKTIVDIGTSLGITTSYLASANKNITVYTHEGCKNTTTQAKKTFKNLLLTNIKLKEGEFSETLHQTINELDTVDLVFFDGNHQYKPTLAYFEMFLDKINENTCFIFDDIYWSKDMTKAWNVIKSNPKVMISIDTFYFGICFFRQNQPKQHFILRT